MLNATAGRRTWVRQSVSLSCFALVTNLFQAGSA